MSARFRELWDNLREDRLLFPIGVLGLVLGVGLLGFMAIRGSAMMEPEGHLRKAATFDIAVGIFILTMILMERAVPMSVRGRKRWAGVLAVMVLYGYGMETVQILRGIDPRFSSVGSPVDQILGGVFFLSAIMIMVMFLVLAARFFRRPADAEDGPLLVALRYGSIAAVIGFVVGIVISANGTAAMGDQGSWLPLHALGFHGVQAVPLVALLLAWGGADSPGRRRAVHIAGVAWLIACLAAAWQTMAGQMVLATSIPMVIGGLAFIVWAVTFAGAALKAT